MITILQKATDRIQIILAQVNDEEVATMHLRIFVQGGGCTGFSYGFKVEDTIDEEDYQFECGSHKVLVDPISYPYLKDSEIDFKDDLSGSSFSINNPNATSKCGCGSSFGV